MTVSFVRTSARARQGATLLRSRTIRSWATALGAAPLLVCFGIATPSTATTVAASWEFDQAAGVVQDQQAGDNDLTLLGQWSSVAGPESDPSAIRFAATGAAATTTVANGAHFNPGSGAFALTVVFRATKDVTKGTPNLAQHGWFNNSGQIKIQLAARGKVGCRIKGDRAAYLFYSPKANVNDNLWHTVTCARSATDVSVTIDGVSFSPAGSEDPGAISVPNQPFRFAQKPGGGASDQFIGDIGFASYSA